MFNRKAHGHTICGEQVAVMMVLQSLASAIGLQTRTSLLILDRSTYYFLFLIRELAFVEVLYMDVATCFGIVDVVRCRCLKTSRWRKDDERFTKFRARVFNYSSCVMLSTQTLRVIRGIRWVELASANRTMHD